ncbi:hypothetical protein [Aquimarina sp. AU58]|uniref:hypothetical protein n=1 Tax=Aquimarina sp. AU58 TaxID=1874112 RepID=UPI000D6E07FF|nr:hypothetical protein [Aquimarina sp. AU58]
MDKTLELETYAVEGKLYKHESKSIVATEKMMMKNSSEAILEQTYVRQNPLKNGNIFHVKTHSENYGKENATLKITKDMNSLINDIGVITDQTGKVIKITNKHEVLDKWGDLKKRWKKETTKEDREQVLRTIATIDHNIVQDNFDTDVTNQGALHFLFSGLYGAYPKKEGKVMQKDLSKFLVTQPLPLLITYTIVEHNKRTNAMVIEGVGELDEDRLDKETLNKLIRALKDKINLKVELQVSYKERFEFDSHHWLDKAMQQVKVKIPGFYMTESEQTISQIDQYE